MVAAEPIPTHDVGWEPRCVVVIDIVVVLDDLVLVLDDRDNGSSSVVHLVIVIVIVDDSARYAAAINLPTDHEQASALRMSIGADLRRAGLTFLAWVVLAGGRARSLGEPRGVPGGWLAGPDDFVGRRPSQRSSRPNSLHRMGTPLRSCSPRSTSSIPDPTIRSFTVLETSTSPGSA